MGRTVPEDSADVAIGEMASELLQTVVEQDGDHSVIINETTAQEALPQATEALKWVRKSVNLLQIAADKKGWAPTVRAAAMKHSGSNLSNQTGPC